jgi:hypothetical protein
VSSKVWEEYGTDWVELDAPRHLYLHSLKSIKLLAKEEDFELVDFFCDSTELEFWGSEQYRRDIPLMSEDSFCINPSKSNFTYREISEFKKTQKEHIISGRTAAAVSFFKHDWMDVLNVVKCIKRKLYASQHGTSNELEISTCMIRK